MRKAKGRKQKRNPSVWRLLKLLKIAPGGEKLQQQFQVGDKISWQQHQLRVRKGVLWIGPVRSGKITRVRRSPLGRVNYWVGDKQVSIEEIRLAEKGLPRRGLQVPLPSTRVLEARLASERLQAGS